MNEHGETSNHINERLKHTEGKKESLMFTGTKIDKKN